MSCGLHKATSGGVAGLGSVLAWWLALMVGGWPRMAPAAVPASMSERLRQAVLLPQINLTAGFGFSANELVAEDDIPDLRAEIARLRSRLTGQPSDAAVLLRIARLSRRAGDEAGWRAVSEEAVNQFRKRVALQPDDAAALTGLGEALAETNKDAEAESRLREATRKAPGDWRAWCALGRHLGSRAGSAILNPSGAESKPAKKGSDPAPPQPPSAGDVERFQRLTEEARTCFDKAVAVAPKEYRPYADRAGHLSSVSISSSMLKQALGQEGESSSVALAPYATNAIPDLEAASALAPRDHRLHSAVIFFVVLGHWQSIGGETPREVLAWENLPAAIRDRARPHLNALENLGDDGDPRIAGGALENLALARLLLMQDSASGPALARRALQRDPTRSQAWDMLVGTMVENQRFEELQRLLEDRVRTHPDARNQFLLVKVLAQRDRWDEAEERLAVALEAAPRDVRLRLSRACALLHRRDNQAALATVRAELETVTKLLPTVTDSAERTDLALHTGVTSAIYFAIDGKVDEARSFLKSLGPAAREHPYAKAVLEILGD